MDIILGIIIVFFPFIPLCIVASWFTKLINFEEQGIVIPPTVSPFNSVKINSAIINDYLTSDLQFDYLTAKRVCGIFKNCQLSMIFYLLTGPIQFFSIIVYIFSVFNNFTNIRLLYENESNQLAAYIVLPIMALITFWIFYGSNFFTYIGLEKSEKIISRAIQNLFALFRKIEEKMVSFFLSVLYFILLFLYLNKFIPLVNCIGDLYALKLIWVCLLIFLFYYSMPRLFAHIYSKVNKNAIKLLNKNYIYENLKNATYLHLLFLFFYGILLQNSNSILLQAITILFLYDTYRTKKIENKNVLKDKKTDNDS